MRNAILIHGWNTKKEFFDPDKPTASNDHWFPWLSKQLALNGIKADAPEMPQYDLATYESWRQEVERFDITPQTILVGHSCGSGFIIRYLSENNIKVDRVVLVAPWLGIDFGHQFNQDFFRFKIDPDLVARTNGVTILNSDDDFDAIHESVEIIVKNIKGIDLVHLSGRGHFTRNSLGGEAFPELLKEIRL